MESNCKYTLFIKFYEYRQTSNIKLTVLGNKIVHHSDVVGASPVYILILDLTSGFNWLGTDNSKPWRETFKYGNLVQLILEVWW